VIPTEVGDFKTLAPADFRQEAGNTPDDHDFRRGPQVQRSEEPAHAGGPSGRVYASAS